MGWYKRGWEAGLTTLEEWWSWSTLYLYDEGAGIIQMPRDYPKWTSQLIEFVRDVAEQDPTPIWEVGRLIDYHAGLSPRRGTPATSLADIEKAIDNAIILKDWLLVHGITGNKPGRKKTREVLLAEELIALGLDNNEIQKRTGKSVAHIRNIRSALKAEKQQN